MLYNFVTINGSLPPKEKKKKKVKVRQTEKEDQSELSSLRMKIAKTLKKGEVRDRRGWEETSVPCPTGARVLIVRLTLDL